MNERLRRITENTLQRARDAMGTYHILPERFEQTTVGLLVPGQEGYTLPWGMWVDLERRMWIHPNYPVKAAPFGTCHLHILRQREFVIVYSATIGDQRYTPTAQPGYASPADTVYIPVQMR